MFENYSCDNQMSIFDFLSNDDKPKAFKIDKPIRLIETFSGYGSQYMALKRLGADVESYKISEWNIPSVNLYHAVHCDGDLEKCNYDKEQAVDILLNYGVSMDGKQPLTRENLMRKSVDWLNDVIAKFRATNNLGSILNIKGSDLEIKDTDKYEYILTYSFPCQDLSAAGKGKGMAKGSGTRSSMLWEVERLLNEVENLPPVLVMENVPQVHSKQKKKAKDENGNLIFDENGNQIYEKSNYEVFCEWLQFLESKGYTNFWQDLNSKNYGVAQNRNRCFCVSLLGDYEYKFPHPIELIKTIDDYPFNEVEGKYYIDKERSKDLIDKLILENKLSVGLICSKHGTTHYPHGWLGYNADFSGVMPTIDSGIWKHHTLIIKSNNKKGYEECVNGGIADLNYVSSKTRRGSVQNGGCISPTITCENVPCRIKKTVNKIENEYEIRRLTPRECGRLQDVSDSDICKMEKVESNTQLYKAFGNSITVNCLTAIFGQMLEGKEDVYKGVK